MLQSAPIFAQNKSTIQISWEKMFELSPPVNQLKSLGFAGPVVGVIDDKLIIAGGANFPEAMPWLGGKKKYYQEVYVFSKKGNQVVQEKLKFELPNQLAYAASCNTPIGIIYAGGENENGITNKVHLLKWDATFQNIIHKSLPDLPKAITNAAMVAVGNDLYFLGGESLSATSQDFFHLNLTKLENGWNQLPVIPKPLSNVVLIVQGLGAKKNLFLFGGRAKNKNGISDFSDQSFVFDIERKKWESIKSMPYAMSAGTGIAYLENYILLFGGDKGIRFNEVETINLVIENEKDDLKKQIEMKKKIQLLSSHPGFSNEILLYNTITDTWSTNGLIPTETTVTTTAVQWGNWVIIPSGEIKAGVRSPYVLAAKISQ